MSLQNRLYAVFLDETLSFGVFKGFTLKTFHTLNAFWIKLPLSSFPLVNSQSVLRNFCIFMSDVFYQWKTINPHQWSGHKFFSRSHEGHEKSYSSSSSRMAGTPMAYNSSRVKSINLKWLYFRSACPSSSNLLNAWILFGLSISTMTSWSEKYRSNHLSLTYVLRGCILAT